MEPVAESKDSWLNIKLSSFYGTKWPKLVLPKWPGPDNPIVNIPKFVSKRRIGIEIEVENINNPRWDTTFWNLKGDGSLRNGGVEFVSYPLSSIEIVYALDGLFRRLPKDADFSERTSIHIHVNVRDYTVRHLLNLLIVYLLLERCLYVFAGKERYNNIFCVPIGETRLPILFADLFSEINFTSAVGRWEKYSGLNLLPIRNQGSVEYRHMYGNCNMEYILSWINILLRMHNWAKHMDFRTEYTRLTQLNTTSAYEKEIINILQEEANQIVSQPNLWANVDFGIKQIKCLREPSEFFKHIWVNRCSDAPLYKKLGVPVRSQKESVKYKILGADEWDREWRLTVDNPFR